MNLADRLTASRLFLAPLFFIVFTWGESFGLAPALASSLLILLFVLVEISDLLDGKAARHHGTVSAFGKLFDPFADVFARITYFVCFAFAGIMPSWILLIILYREFSQLFLRMLLAERGIAMGARPGGKLKAVFYALAGGASLALWCQPRFGILPDLAPALGLLVFVLYLLAAFLSVASFVDYLVQFRKLTRAA
jgi:CDP-diacylglycerol--glycerol-3-phosphate 3-phosphatidyltransferase